jgi:hypothetical protein
MNWYVIGAEHLKCPAEYQEHVNAIGGLNRFGDPNFRIVWGQSEFEVVRGRDANGREGAHTISKHANVPAWFVEVWKPPECFGTPELWYTLGWDWELDTCTLGEYPFRGLYMPASFNLYVRKIENNVMTIDAMPLNHWIIDLIIPNLLKAQEETYTQKKIAIQNRMMAEKQAAAKLAMDAYLSAGPAFGGAAGTYESNREAWTKRLLEKQAGMKLSSQEVKRRMGTGHRQIPLDRIWNPTEKPN